MGAGPGLPLERTDVRVGCQERAPRGPSVGAGPRVPLGRDDVRVQCRWRATRGPLVCAGPRVPRVPIGAPRTKKRVSWLPRTGTARSSSGRGPRAASNTPANTPSSTQNRTTPRTPKKCKIIHDSAFWVQPLQFPPCHHHPPQAPLHATKIYISLLLRAPAPPKRPSERIPPCVQGLSILWFYGFRVLGFRVLGF